MLDLHDPLIQVRVTSVVCSSVAILSTLCRIFIRRKRLWADDVAALFSLLALVVQVIAVFITPKPGSNIGEVRYYIIAVTFFSIIWSARLSILLSLIRINPFPEHQTKLKCVAFAFIIIPMLLILQCFLTCIPKDAWKSAAIPQCILDSSNAICQLIADILSDGVLLYVPTRLLIILRDKNLRHRLILIFSTCVITTLVGLSHAIEIFEIGLVKVIYTAIIENNIALIVCNTPVILTSLINLKEAPWEERNFLHEIGNLEVVATTPGEEAIQQQRPMSRVTINPLPVPERALQ